jgi:hypothetical protein
VHTLSGEHLTLYTDVPADAEVEQLPRWFDQAVPQWAEYFGAAREEVKDWRATAYLIKDRAVFDALGLMPKGHDTFRHGLSIGDTIWLYEQPTAYYRRHLLLHEGTHAFMSNALGGCGPGWYMEGIAELLATHQIDEAAGTIELGTMPRSREEVPMLGRIKLVQDAFRENRALGLAAVLEIDNRLPLENESYAWCWALARLMDEHPRYRGRFRELQQYVQVPRFNTRFRERLGKDWLNLAVEWENFVATLEHGHDVKRTAIDFQDGRPLDKRTFQTNIAVDRGWQPSGIRLDAGRSYRIAARGRYQVAREADGQIWWCEPGGVTIEFHAGRPLGILLGAIYAGNAASERRPSDQSHAQPDQGFAQPFEIGLERDVIPTRSGTLYLRINDSPGRLDDNRGELQVSIGGH